MKVNWDGGTSPDGQINFGNNLLYHPAIGHKPEKPQPPPESNFACQACTQIHERSLSKAPIAQPQFWQALWTLSYPTQVCKCS